MLPNLAPSKITWIFRVLPLLTACLPGALLAQAETVKPAIPTVEPGLDQAVKWQWKPEPSAAAAWGVPIETPAETPEVKPGAPATPETVAKATPVTKAAPKGPPSTMLEHVVVKGDSLTKIAHTNGVTVDQLKIFNEMNNDRIVIGQIVKVPGEKDIQAMIAAAAAPAQAAAKEAPKKAAPEKAKKAPSPIPETAPVLIATKPHRALPPGAWAASQLVLIQSFLDRQGFTIGPIDGTAGPVYDAAYKAFEKAQPGQLHCRKGCHRGAHP